MIKFSAILLFLFSFPVFGQVSIEQLEVQKKQLEEEKKSGIHQIELLNAEIEELSVAIYHQQMISAGFPKGNSDQELIHHRSYSLSYNEKHEQANWVMHVLPPEIKTGNFGRTNEFRPDSLILSGTAVKEDYWFSGFDRGHLAPSADFRWSARSINESYLYSNISPQRSDLNRERWAEMEDLLRSYVIKTGHPLLIVTGPVLKDSLPFIGKQNKVSIPEFFFKIAIDIHDSVQSGIAFLMPNQSCEYPSLTYAVSIDSIEALTGYNFFPDLSSDLQTKTETGFVKSYWQKIMDEGNFDPFDPSELPSGTFNTIQAKYQVGNKITVCGTVVSTKLAEKSGATFINLDRKFPNQVFTITIWEDDRKNFSYAPETYLIHQKICVLGKITLYQDVPTQNITSEEAIQVTDIQYNDD